MQNYCYGAGCFSGDGIVKLSSGKTKLIKNLQKNDEIICSSKNNSAKVLCLITFPINRKMKMIKINNLLLT